MNPANYLTKLDDSLMSTYEQELVEPFRKMSRALHNEGKSKDFWAGNNSSLQKEPGSPLSWAKNMDVGNAP